MVIGHDLATVATDLLERLLAAGGELVTLVVGADEDAGRRRPPRTWSRRSTPPSSVVVYDGGQEQHPRCWSGSSRRHDGRPWRPPLSQVRGPKTAKGMFEQLGLHTVGDLLRHYPRR